MNTSRKGNFRNQVKFTKKVLIMHRILARMISGFIEVKIVVFYLQEKQENKINN